MSSQPEPEIILYDLACAKNVCFSPVVWRIRLMLNYKKVPYRTIFLEFQEIEPTLKGLGLVPGESTANSKIKYTVPAIRHVPTNTYIMDSWPIAQFIESTYPDPAVPLKSDLGAEIEAKSRAMAGSSFRASVMPREIKILSPGAAEYFRRTREGFLGHRLEDLLEGDREEKAWKAAEAGRREVDTLLRTNRADGPFILGEKPSYADFFIAGNLQCARVVDEGVFLRNVELDGFKGVYEACLPFMEKRD